MSTLAILLTLAAPHSPGQFLGDAAAACLLLAGLWHGFAGPLLRCKLRGGRP